MSRSKDKWRIFEHIVAAVHETEKSGAKVKWDETIDGRQFDVTVRQCIGNQQLLTVIECKSGKNKVPVKEVDALVTKAKDAEADNAVIICESGFQSGCIGVAKRHGITLLTLNEAAGIPVQQLSGSFTLGINIKSILIHPQNENEFPLSNKPPKLEWQIKKAIVTTGHQSTSLSETLSKLISTTKLSTQPQCINFSLKGAHLQLPDRKELIILGSVSCVANFTKVAILPNGLDPWLRNRSYDIQDHTGKQVSSTQALGMKRSQGDTIRPGKFYYDPAMDAPYYCDSISDGVARIVALELYQHGELLRAVAKAEVKLMTGYVEIRDKKEIQRLQQILDETDILN